MAGIEVLREQFTLQHHEISEGPISMLAKPHIVIYPGTSSRRRALFTHVFPTQEFRNVSIGAEPEGDLRDVMRFKLGEALPHLQHTGEECMVVMAADTQNITPFIDPGLGCTIMKSHMKPKTSDETYTMLCAMQHFAQNANQNPFYIGDSSSGMLHVNRQVYLVEDRRKTLVELDPEKFGFLTEPDGFETYLKEFAGFYSSPPYTTNDMKVEITDLSGGISLPVLVRMGLVSSIDGVNRQDPYFRTKLMEGVYNVAIGISPKLLELVGVSGEVINQWPWLNGVVDSALSE